MFVFLCRLRRVIYYIYLTSTILTVYWGINLWFWRDFGSSGEFYFVRAADHRDSKRLNGSASRGRSIIFNLSTFNSSLLSVQLVEPSEDVQIFLDQSRRVRVAIGGALTSAVGVARRIPTKVSTKHLE
jgi:hypothetical protein